MLVVDRLGLKLREVAKESVKRKLDLDQLKDPATQREFSLRLQNRFKVLVEMEIQGPGRNRIGRHLGKQERKIWDVDIAKEKSGSQLMYGP